ncbi:MAG: pilus assembly protein [Rhodospirillaceae bacterium]|jgi:pilus assembly protein CpaE|nr:pilus assembly protein [Rhodospirillaceae bacterium]
MIRALRHLLTRNSGNSAVEFAIAAPVLAVLLLGSWEYGVVVWKNFRMVKGLDAGTQYAVLGASDDAIVSTALQAAGLGGVSSANVRRYCTCPTGESIACTTSCPTASYKRVLLEVTMNHTHQTYFTYPIVEPTIPLAKSATIQLP